MRVCYAVAVLGFCLLLERATGVLFGQEPGFRVVLTRKGLDYVSSVCGPLLRERLSGLQFTDLHDSTKVKLVGKIKYSLTQISLKAVNVPDPVLQLEEEGLRVRVSGMSLNMDARWAYEQKKWPHVADDGSVEIKAKGISLSQRLLLKEDGSGGLTVSSDMCLFDVKKISVEFRGGASWVYNLFTSFIERRIEEQLRDQVCKITTNAVNDFRKKMSQSLPMTVPVRDGMEVNCALFGDPVFTTSYVATHHNGEFISSLHPHEAPISPLPLPNLDRVDTSHKMLYVWLTSYPIDTAAQAYWQEGYMQSSITHDQVPSFLPRTTTDFKKIIPQLYERYPNRELMYDVSATNPPSLLLSPGRARLLGEAEVRVSVLDPYQSQHAFSVRLSLLYDVELEVQRREGTLFLTGEVTAASAEVGDVSSDIGDIDASPLQELAKVATTFLAVPIINRILNEGYALTSIGDVSATNTVLSIAEGHILVETDLSYIPS